MKRLRTDILILGSGGAGLFAALHARRVAPELEVTIAVKGLLGKCGCTRMVQGGYNVALNPGDSIERHFMDTIEGGKWLPNQEMAWTLVTRAIERVQLHQQPHAAGDARLHAQVVLDEATRAPVAERGQGARQGGA